MATCAWVYPYCIDSGTKWLGHAPFCDKHFGEALQAARTLIVPGANPLPVPKFKPWPSVVYYVTWPGHCETEVKIGTTACLVKRLDALTRRGTPPAVLVAERGSYETERRRHRQFSTLRLNDQVTGLRSEIFRRAPVLDEHMARLREACPDWPTYAKL